MNDPSGGVPPQLLRHIHLLCNYNYAVLPTPSIEVAVKHLQEAPKVTRDVSTMTWKAILEPPRDGTILLAWQPPQLGTNFASDGYVWADPERAYSQQMEGFTVEMYMQNTGFRPGLESTATHARRRYRLMPSRDFNPNMPPIDPSLWLIHYYTAEPKNQIPTRNIQVSEPAGRALAERNSLHAHGQLQLQHKEFMLRDRDNWPTINLPGSNAPAFPGQAMGYPNNVMAHMSRGQHPPYPQQPPAGPAQNGTGPSPAKRARHAPSNQPAPSMTAIPVPELTPEALAEEDEMASAADYMDSMTPQQLSRARFIQHHEWLEEVISSPYSSYQIVPGSLGLGRKGELESLTRDFFEAPEFGKPRAPLNLPTTPTPEDHKLGKRAVPDDQPDHGSNHMAPGKAEDFAKRAEQRMEDLQLQMDRLKKQHAKRMAKMQKSQNLRDAEQALRKATLDLMSSERGKNDTEHENRLESMIQQIENDSHRKVQPMQEIVVLEKGGLEEKTAPSQLKDADVEMGEDDDIVTSEANLPDSSIDRAVSSPQAATGYAPPTTATQPNPTEFKQPDGPGLSGDAAPANNETIQAEDWVMVGKEADAANGAAEIVQDEPSLDAFNIDVHIPETTIDETEVGPEATLQHTADDMTFNEHDFGSAIDFGDLDGVGADLSEFTQGLGDLDSLDVPAQTADVSDSGPSAPNTEAPAEASGQAPT